MTDTATTKETTASPTQVWAVLSDGFTYDKWVAGTKEIRDVDTGWPSKGAAIHYTVGAGPINYKNRTVSRDCLTERLLELEVHATPFGTVRVGISIEPSGSGSKVTLDEHPYRGPMRLLHNPLTRLGFLARTSTMIDDLIELAEAKPPSTTSDS
ncbi:MAG: SRPBCC family protein [Nocardioidaceae bacterium]|nr:SRPBCC family protein [Nocardioidaceae bacterium]